MRESLCRCGIHQKMFVQYIILVRHGSRQKAYNRPRRTHNLENADYKRGTVHGHQSADPGKPGRPASLSLAGWLAEALALHNIEVWHVLHSHQEHAKETAEAYLQALRPQGLCWYNLRCQADGCLNPEISWHDLKTVSKVKGKIAATINGRALMICGHQPQLTWIANAFLGRSDPLPLRQSEAACLKIAPRPQLIWAIAGYHKETMSELRAKVQSKMNVAMFFAGFISLLLGVLFTKADGWPVGTQDRIWALFHYFGTASALLSVGLCVGAIFAYDRLMMPTLFWGGKPRNIDEDTHGLIATLRQLIGFTPIVRRPPSQAHWVIHSNMVQIWDKLFKPAVVSFFIGLSCILIAVMKPPILPALVLAGVLLLSFGVYRILRPELGFDD